MILARLFYRLLAWRQEASTHDRTVGLTSLKLRGLPKVQVYGLEAPAAPEWPRCGSCGTKYNPERLAAGKVTCLSCERGTHPALGKLIKRRDAVLVAVSDNEGRVN